MGVALRPACLVSIAGLLALAVRSPAHAGITDCQGLCGTSNPCTIEHGDVKVIDPGAVLDCSDRSITVDNGRIEVTNGSFVLKAVRLTVERSMSVEAKCTAPGGRPGFTLVLSDKLELWGFLRANCDFGGGFVHVEAAGDVTIHDTGGAYDNWGVLANGMTSDAAGGSISIESETGDVTIADPVQADVKGNGLAPGGSIQVRAPAGSVTVSADLLATGRQDRGGSIDLEAAGNLTVGASISAHGRLAQGNGGEVHLAAGNALVLNATVSAQGGLDAGGGWAAGGVIDLDAGLGGIAINATLDATSGGQGPGGDGGAIVAESLGNVTVHTGVALLAKSDGNGGDGGGISLVTHGARRCAGDTAHRCDADPECGASGPCQLLGGQLTLEGATSLDARGHTGQGQQGAGANVDLRGCAVSVASGAVILATGYTGGEVTLTGRDSLTVDGSVTATGSSQSGGIRLVTPAGTSPSVGGTLNPSPQLASDGVHPCN